MSANPRLCAWPDCGALAAPGDDYCGGCLQALRSGRQPPRESRSVAPPTTPPPALDRVDAPRTATASAYPGASAVAATSRPAAADVLRLRAQAASANVGTSRRELESRSHRPIETVLFSVDGARKSGSGWSAKCPAHEDSKASLSITEGEDGKVLLWCHSNAGCDFASIVKALGVEEGDLFPPKDREGRRIIAEYAYMDETGIELFQAVRFEPKDFRQRHREKGGPWIWKLDGVRRVLYRLPELLEGVKAGATVCVVEGEKDVEALRSLGLVATCNPMGAGKWRDEYAEALCGARVVIIADKDEPGRKHARAVEASLRGKASSVHVVEVVGGKDAAAWIALGASRGDFERLAETTVEQVAQAGGSADVVRTMEEAAIARPVLVALSTVKRERVSWLWPGRVPFGKLTDLEGDPGLGKSTLGLDLLARATTGRPMPDGGQELEPMSAIILSAEDGLADTIRPRLEAAEADLSRVHALTAVKLPDGAEVFPTLTENLAQIRAAVVETGARIVVVDPFVAYIGADVNSWRDQDVRRCLAPLAALAEDLGVAVILIRHLTKGGGAAAIYRGGGSIGIVAACRSALLVAKDPEDEDRRILAPVKSNLCAPPPSLAYRMETRGEVARLVWEPGTVEMSAGELLSAQGEDGKGADGPSMMEEAGEFLRDLLQHGAVGTIAVQKAAREAGHSWITTRRAKERLGITAEKGEKGDPAWYWRLPSARPQGAQGAHLSVYEHHEHLGPLELGESAGNPLPSRLEPLSGAPVQDAHGAETAARRRSAGL